MSDRADIVINGYGASLRKKSNRFFIENDGEKYEFAATQIKQILITGAASISSEALKLASDEGVDIVICKRNGDPSCRVLPCNAGGIATTRRHQIIAAGNEIGHALITLIIRAKIIHMGRFIGVIGRRRDNSTLIDEAAKIELVANHLPQKGLLSDHSDVIRGIEGNASRLYFAALSLVIHKPIYLGYRSQHPAEDVFNAYLNYGYGILYNEVEKACILAGLDPYAGFLHGDRYGNKALVYDLIEPFRQPVIDHVVVTLAVRDQMDVSDLDDKGWLTPEAKRRLVTAVISGLDKERDIQGRKTSFRQFIKDNIRKAGHYMTKGHGFHPLDWRWR
ncbi:CRISPR-associated endonuclease Cas1 [Methanospirillum sp.]|uniref:CRISPR-associated endonuclease Cas1 n=1 Tax=Methanospirillum sp. TaxID=45200 RepID=UPI0035A1522C